MTPRILFAAGFCGLLVGCAGSGNGGEGYRYEPIYISGNRMTYKFDIDQLRSVTAEAAKRCRAQGKGMEIEGTPNCGAAYTISKTMPVPFQDCIGNFICK